MKNNVCFRRKYYGRLQTKIRLLFKTLLVVFLETSNFLVFGQVNQLETDKGIAASIAPYNADVRQAILQASQYPQILTQIQQNQSQAQVAFQQVISGFSQKKQGWVYTLTRYPDLIHNLATLSEGHGKNEVYQLLPNQDSDLQNAAWKLYHNEKRTLEEIDNIKFFAQQGFDKAIENYNAPTRAAFQKLSTLPDVLTLMTNNVNLTSRLGILYKENPIELNNQLAALHDSLNVQNQYEIETFKKQMADDPQATQELSEAAKSYAKSNGYEIPDQPIENWDTPYYYANPYSYWFGYPYWYAYPLWYPRAFWYEFGFYRGISGFGVYGFPSLGFAYWFFNNGFYHRYPHLYRRFGEYYRTNLAGRRFMGPVNGGFMEAAHKHFNARGNNDLHFRSFPPATNRPRGQSDRSGVNASHSNSSNYHSQSWETFGGKRGNTSRNGNTDRNRNNTNPTSKKSRGPR